VFKSIRPAAVQKAAGKSIALYDPSLPIIKVLDFCRVNRQSEILRPAMIRQLAKTHGESWYSETAKLLK
jgi:hypothetical protein